MQGDNIRVKTPEATPSPLRDQNASDQTTPEPEDNSDPIPFGRRTTKEIFDRIPEMDEDDMASLETHVMEKLRVALARRREVKRKEDAAKSRGVSLSCFLMSRHHRAHRGMLMQRQATVKYYVIIDKRGYEDWYLERKANGETSKTRVAKTREVPQIALDNEAWGKMEPARQCQYGGFNEFHKRNQG